MKTYVGAKIAFVFVVIFCVASTVRFSMKIGNPYAAEFGETIAEGGGAVRHYNININSNSNSSKNSNNNNGTTTTTTNSLRRIEENIKKEKQKESKTNNDDDDVKIQKENEKDDDDDDDDDSVDEVTQKGDDDDDEEQEQEGEESNKETNATFLFDTNTNSDDNSFSACIMWMDDNHRLEEWLAYHYYIMKLRYVVIAVDQKSRTSPQHIVDRWNDYENKYNNLNMTIITWKDSDYISDYRVRMKEIDEAESMSILEHGNEKTRYHRYRQHEFYRMCSTHLLKQNKTWVCTCFVCFVLFYFFSI
jgi:ABC-type antimicrobial peptide transport system permease subunit